MIFYPTDINETQELKWLIKIITLQIYTYTYKLFSFMYRILDVLAVIIFI